MSWTFSRGASGAFFMRSVRKASASPALPIDDSKRPYAPMAGSKSPLAVYADRYEESAPALSPSRSCTQPSEY